MSDVQPGFTDLADHIRRTVSDLDTEPGVRVVAIGGYPYTGKTRLAHAVVQGWPGPGLVLPTESVISSRATRLQHGWDGSSEVSHDGAALLSTLDALRRGESVTVPRYSWSTGSFDGHDVLPALGAGALVVLDGSIATAPSVRSAVDLAFALAPTSFDRWLKRAQDRDVAERNWQLSAAESQNLAKARTVRDQLTTFGDSPHERLIEIWMASDGEWTLASSTEG